jgi:glycosyltransferase involved in cell wall biosynthesis
METTNYSSKLISICIAAYNDENTIEQLIRESVSIFENLQLNFEIIIINDDSIDGTGKILQRLGSSLQFLKLINHKQNKGYGATIKELLYSSSGEIVFTLPGDFQIPPQVITKMLPLINEYDIVIGSRVPRNDPLIRKINSVIYNKAINFLFNTGLTDINSTKLIKRNVIKGIDLISDGPFIDAELCAKAVKKGFRIKEVNIEHRQRLFGSPSGSNPRIMWKALKETLSMIGKI